MKKLSLKSKILLSAILLGGGIAGAQTLVNMPKAADPTYDWTSNANAPQNPSSTLDDKTIEQAMDHFGCEGEGPVCASGELVSGSGDATATIRLN